MDYELLIPIFAILVGGLIVLLPLAGLVLRFALKPAIESYVQAKQASSGGADHEHIAIIEERVALLEAQIRGVLAERTGNVLPPR
jgi:hypothetical protein